MSWTARSPSPTCPAYPAQFPLPQRPPAVPEAAAPPPRAEDSGDGHPADLLDIAEQDLREGDRDDHRADHGGGEGAGGAAAAGELTRCATMRAPLLGWRRRTEGLTALRESFIPVPGTAAPRPVVRNLFGPPGILSRMLDVHTSDRLAMVSKRARDAEARGDDALAGEEWRHYRLVRDAGRDPDELLAEGIALSVQAAELAGR